MDEFARYDRQIKLSEIGEEGQKKLQESSVLIAGSGGLGCPAALYLAAAGVGTIGLIDHDVVDETNLHRQVLFTEGDIGRSKAEAARAALHKRNSTITIEAYTDPFDLENALDLVEKFDLILDGTDNFQTKYLINDACIKVDKPFVGASIYKYQGQLSVFNHKGGPGYRCLYPTHHRRDNNNCEETGVLGVLPGIMGTMQAAEALKVILGISSSLSGKLKIIDTLSMQEQLISFHRNEDEIERVKGQKLKLEEAKCKNLLEIPLNKLKDRHQEIPRDEKVTCIPASLVSEAEKRIMLLEKEFGFNNLVDVGGIEELIE